MVSTSSILGLRSSAPSSAASIWVGATGGLYSIWVGATGGLVTGWYSGDLKNPIVRRGVQLSNCVGAGSGVLGSKRVGRRLDRARGGRGAPPRGCGDVLAARDRADVLQYPGSAVGSMGAARARGRAQARCRSEAGLRHAASAVALDCSTAVAPDRSIARSREIGHSHVTCVSGRHTHHTPKFDPYALFVSPMMPDASRGDHS